MGDLPPRAPVTMTQNFWPSLPLQILPTTAAPPASWADEFLDFSALRRSAYRRTVSDPITFVEVPVENGGGRGGFEKLDDEPLRNMFNEDVAVTNASSSNPSSPSDQNSENDEDKGVVAERRLVEHKNEPVESQCSPETTPPAVKSAENVSTKTIVDPKRIKRILANRQSAQRSRVRKLHYISQLERSVMTLQSEVSALSPRVAFMDHQRLLLSMDNSALKQRIAALAQDNIFKDAHQEALRKEIERLGKIYDEQKMKKKNEIDGDAEAGGNSPAPELDKDSRRTED